MVSIRRNVDRYWQQVTASPILDELGGLSHIVLNIDDISERAETQAQMEKLAFYDPLTGMENRRLFKDRLDQALKHVRRTKKIMALLYLDLDQFKRINDTLRHDAGDELLCAVARRLRDCVREEDIVCRLGGMSSRCCWPMWCMQMMPVLSRAKFSKPIKILLTWACRK